MRIDLISWLSADDPVQFLGDALADGFRRCVECSRLFDLSDETDSAEWHYGHDCEV